MEIVYVVKINIFFDEFSGIRQHEYCPPECRSTKKYNSLSEAHDAIPAIYEEMRKKFSDRTDVDILLRAEEWFNFKT